MLGVKKIEELLVESVENVAKSRGLMFKSEIKGDGISLNIKETEESEEEKFYITVNELKYVKCIHEMVIDLAEHPLLKELSKEEVQDIITESIINDTCINNYLLNYGGLPVTDTKKNDIKSAMQLFTICASNIVGRVTEIHQDGTKLKLKIELDNPDKKIVKIEPRIIRMAKDKYEKYAKFITFDLELEDIK